MTWIPDMSAIQIPGVVSYLEYVIVLLPVAVKHYSRLGFYIESVKNLFENEFSEKHLEIIQEIFKEHFLLE